MLSPGDEPWVSKPKYLIGINLAVHTDASGRTSQSYTCGEKIKAVNKLAAVTESLLPFINGPSRLKLVN